MDHPGIEAICSWCRRVRNSTGVWSRIELDASGNEFGHFTHGICPGCLEANFQELARIIGPTSGEKPNSRQAEPELRP